MRSESKFWSNGSVPWFTVEDIRNQGKVIYSTQQHITEEAITTDRIVPANSFLLCCTASVGEYAQTKIALTTNQQFNALTVKNSHKDLLIDEYLFGIGEYFSSLLHSAAGKTTFEFVSVKKLGAFLIPVPPKKEQQRIIDALQEFDPILKEYDKLEQQATKLDTEIYDKLKKSTLQYAIQGKLVEQDENDEPASILLERIRAEKKAQLGKKYVESYIYKGDDNCYYEKIGSEIKNITEEIEGLGLIIPKSWEYTRLSSITRVITKGTTPRDENVQYLSSGIGFLRAENIAGLDRLNKREMKYIDPNTHTGFLKRSIIEWNDILITIAGTLGRTALVRANDLPLNSNQAVSIIRLTSNTKLDLKYLIFALNCNSIQRLLTTQKKITAIPNLTLEIISNCIVPIPPLNEQKRIVEAVDKIFSKIKDEN